MTTVLYTSIEHLKMDHFEMVLQKRHKYLAVRCFFLHALVLYASCGMHNVQCTMCCTGCLADTKEEWSNRSTTQQNSNGSAE